MTEKLDPPTDQRRLYDHDVTDALKCGALSPAAYASALSQTQDVLEPLRQKGESGGLSVLETAFWKDDFFQFQSIGVAHRRFHSVLIIGMGGASLGGKALTALFQSWVMSDSSFPFIYFLDNLDPEIFWELMSVLNPRTTGVIVISKSGETPETLIQLMRCLEYWQEFLSPHELASHFTVVTSPGKNALSKIAKHFRFTLLNHPPDVGGRFSCLTVTGLLPVLITGGDPRKVRQGASQVFTEAFAEEESAPVQGTALLWGLFQQKAITSHVMMAYGDAFQDFNMWHRQLWAESLGKEGKGFTPLTALAPADHHSQLQLYLDGPHDKVFTLLSERQLPREKPKPEMWKDFPELNFLAYASLEDLVHAQLTATAQMLTDRGCPVRKITVSTLNERSMGALFAHFIVETLLMAELLGVNPFDQPAVEGGKILAKRFLTQPGR